MKSFEGNDSETNRRRQRAAGKRQMRAMLSDEEEDETPEEVMYRLTQEELRLQDDEAYLDPDGNDTDVVDR